MVAERQRCGGSGWCSACSGTECSTFFVGVWGFVFVSAEEGGREGVDLGIWCFEFGYVGDGGGEVSAGGWDGEGEGVEVRGGGGW